MKRILRRVGAMVLLLLCLLLAAGCSVEEADTNTEGLLRFHLMDVGQADAIFIQADGCNMLVDAGNRDDGPLVVSYLKAHGVKTLDYVVPTHPHEDHIGGMTAVFRAFPVEAVILSEGETTTWLYEELLDAIAAEDCAVHRAQVGAGYSLGNGEFTILSPGADYEDNLNNWSVALRLVYGTTSFVLCGDAEREAEADMLQSGLTLKADVLKLGHHGSSTSTTEAFLEAVGPDYALISCGENNDYGHPHRETMALLEDVALPYFRTDLQGTIIAETDGQTLTWNKDPIVPEAPKAREYVLNTNTMKFHLPSCESVGQITPQYAETVTERRSALIARGYAPCGSCRP